MFTFLKRIFGPYEIEKCTLDEIVQRTSSFLGPQLEVMARIEGNKFGFITIESVAYILNVARAVGRRPIADDEFVTFFVGVLGDEYRPMAQHRLESLHNPRVDHDKFARMVKATGQIVREDLRKGPKSSSNFLVNIAEDHAQWQKKVSAASL